MNATEGLGTLAEKELTDPEISLIVVMLVAVGDNLEDLTIQDAINQFQENRKNFNTNSDRIIAKLKEKLDARTAQSN